MSLKLKEIPEEVLGAIRQNLGVKPDDTSRDKVIAEMTVRQAFDRFLTWNGIIGYAGTIMAALDDLTEAGGKDDPR